ncbi:T9SS type A sorting domain-containing protein, partial [candidate division KSB1 bacterium]|nr:T9SS type A sorting domain-containing protein [candidate division KSB1 bacterium]
FQKTRWEGRNDRGHDVGSGVYFMQLEVGKQKFHRRIILQK